MEIQSLKLFLTEDELNNLARQHTPPTEGLADVRLSITSEGVVVQGQYEAGFFKVPFETTWQIAAAGPELHVKLASIRVAGLPGGILRGALMKMARDAVEDKPGIRVTDDAIIVHVPDALRPHGVQLRIHFVVVRLSIKALVVEAGSIPPS